MVKVRPSKVSIMLFYGKELFRFGLLYLFIPGNPIPHRNMPSVQKAKLLNMSSVALEISGQSRIVSFDISAVSLSESIVARIEKCCGSRLNYVSRICMFTHEGRYPLAHVVTSINLPITY